MIPLALAELAPLGDLSSTPGATEVTGVVIDSRRIAELPVAQGSPFSLMYLSPGVVYALAGASPQQSPQAITADSDFLSVCNEITVAL